jgi:hypothetical protein
MQIRDKLIPGPARTKETAKSDPAGQAQDAQAPPFQSEKVLLSGAGAVAASGAKVRRSHSGVQSRSWKEETESLFQHFRSLEEDPHAGRTAKIVIGMLGAAPFLGGPRDSLVDRSYRNMRPSEDLLPALRIASNHHVTASTVEAVDLAQEMFDAIPMNWDRPMDKAYAGIRMGLALAGLFGKVRCAETSEEFFMSPLANLKDDGQPPALAQVTIQQVRKDFDKLREMAREFDERGVLEESSPAKKIVVKEKTVEIGGVRLAIKQG